MSGRKKAMLTLPLLVVMVFSLLAPMTMPVYAATDSYTIVKDTSAIKKDAVDNVWGNSKYYLYLVKNGTYNYSLVRQSKSTGKTKTLIKKLPNKVVNGESDYYDINAVYGNYVYLTRSSFYKWAHWTYRYNLKTKKLTRVTKKAGIMEQRGRYLLGKNEYQSDVSARRHSLYKIIDGGKIKKIKSLGHIANPTKVGKYLYYTYCEDSSLHKVKVYRIRFNGKGKKLLGTFTSKDEYGQVICYDFHAKWCKVSKDGKTYKYTYATKKLKKI